MVSRNVFSFPCNPRTFPSRHSHFTAINNNVISINVIHINVIHTNLIPKQIGLSVIVAKRLTSQNGTISREILTMCLFTSQPISSSSSLSIAIFIGRSKILYLTFEIYRLENDFYYGQSYIARNNERIRFNGQTNDRCAADRELEIRETLVRTQKVGFVSANGEAWIMLMSSNSYIRIS